MPNASHNKKPNRQHGVKGASLLALSKDLARKSEAWRTSKDDPYDVNYAISLALLEVSRSCKAEGDRVRKLR